MQKEANWIRLEEIAKIAKEVLENKVADKQQIKDLDMEVSAMLRSLASKKTFFKRLS